jgi:hypothetical protein
MRERFSSKRALFAILLISLSAAGCDFSDTGSAGAGAPVLPGQTALATINASGGTGTVGTGGNADGDWGIYLESYGPLGIQVLRDGAADASFTPDIPAVTANPGSEPWNVTGDTIVPLADNNDSQGNGTYYLLQGDSNLYHKVDGTTIRVVTGIRIGEGATLTLAMNTDRNGSSLNDSSTLDLQNDIEILGVLRTASFDDSGTQDSVSPKDRGGLFLSTYGSVLNRPAGVVRTAGMDAVSGVGGHGGSIEIRTYRGEAPEGGIFLNQGSIDASGGSTTDAGAQGGTAAYWGSTGTVTMESDGKFANAGAIRAVGGNGGTDGGAGANNIYLYAGLPLYNTGAISLDGGQGGSGNGGSAGSVQITSSAGSVFTSGPLSAKGGEGAVYGGKGGSVELSGGSPGSVLNSGAVDVGGGDGGTDAANPTYGGNGGQIIFYCYAGDMISSGTLSADGGKGMNANAGSTGGNGGSIEFDSYPSWDTGLPAGRMEISNDLSVRGGDGANGGYGGYVYLYYSGDYGATGGIILRGYGEIAGNGGDGDTAGGSGGYVYLYADPGGVLNEVEISIQGGGTFSAGGSGGVE